MNRTNIAIAAAILLFCGCSEQKNPYSPNGMYGQMDNSKEFGVVISTDEKSSTNVPGIATAVGNGLAAPATSAATVAVAPSAGIFSGFTSSVGSGISSIFSSNKTDASSVADTLAIRYLIQKTDGQQIIVNQIPEEGEQILYPGQKVAIQHNDGYVRVYPADVENRHPTR